MDVLLDVARVEKMAKDCAQMATVCRRVNKQLGECARKINQTAYTGRVGGKFVKMHIAILQPSVIDLGNKLNELAGDIYAAMRAVSNGDAEGATRFH